MLTDKLDIELFSRVNNKYDLTGLKPQDFLSAMLQTVIGINWQTYNDLGSIHIITIPNVHTYMYLRVG